MNDIVVAVAVAALTVTLLGVVGCGAFVLVRLAPHLLPVLSYLSEARPAERRRIFRHAAAHPDERPPASLRVPTPDTTRLVDQLKAEDDRIAQMPDGAAREVAIERLNAQLRRHASALRVAAAGTNGDAP